MTIRGVGRWTAAFLIAVAVTAVLASAVQTQINLSALVALGAEIPAGLRIATTLRDAAFFGPVMAAITAAAFLPAFAAARLVARPGSGWSLAVHAVAGVAGLWVAFAVMGFFTPMPTLVAAARTQTGLLTIVATGLIGGALFAYVQRPSTGWRTSPTRDHRAAPR